VVLGTVRAMASDVTVHGCGPVRSTQARAALHRALRVFSSVDAACTRFNPESPLMRANGHPDRWHRVPRLLYEAVLEAHRAYERTDGRFDPRVLGDLVRLGYDRSLRFDGGDVDISWRTGIGRRPGRWRPRFRGGPNPELHLGGAPVDLGGIGKGLAVRWAVRALSDGLESFLIDAGGDCACRGPGPGGGGWRVGVEDADGDGLIAVLELFDQACTTSSIRVRQWKSGGRPVHHLIDPRTGLPGGRGLQAVTVVADDPADAEVMAKALFLRGGSGIAEEARRRNLAALWTGTDRTVAESPRMSDHVLWRSA
jgi:thiamine biosynthesis lipoprotein